MENKIYHLRYLPIFEQDLISTTSYITNVLKNEDAALRLMKHSKSPSRAGETSRRKWR